ncbi:nucleotidyl transferase AbiEii/AbiGii toxin family protein [Clostridium sp. DSM 17811]|uniref:nucleotidyl transferase AbiEii/AbiGii toxin family protein n=1 Tax=Clostridium sp. DSM 17811 TaxID=2843317 RepID=UPI00345EC860
MRDEADYAGFRVSLDTNFDEVKQNLKIDITTGDTMTPREVEYKFDLMFEERTIQILAYNLETVLAEKLETIISRGTTNTRMRDFYDVYILTKLQADNINYKLLAEALNATAIKRGTLPLFQNKSLIITEIETASVMQGLWKRYKKNYDYAESISGGDVKSVINALAA